MRVTERSQMNMLMTAQTRAENRLDLAARIAGQASQVAKPSDNPAGYGSMIRKNFALAILEQHIDIATQAQGELDIAQNALSTGINILTRAKEVALGANNTTSDAEARKLAGDEIMMLRGQLLAVANTRHANKYLFGGTKTDVAPFDNTGTFVGNDQTISVPILEGVSAPVTVSGAKAFTSVGGRDIFSDLDKLAQALYNNDTQGITASLDPLEASNRQVVRAQVDAGFGSERFKNALDVLASTKEAISSQLQQEINGEPTAQLTELSLARSAYERSIAVTKELLSMNAQSR